MKKLPKKEVIKLIKLDKYSAKELSHKTGYHEKSIIRLKSQIRNNTVSLVHGNTNKKPHNYVANKEKEKIIKAFKEGDYKSYQEFFNKTNFNYSYSFIAKLLSDNNLKPHKEKNMLIKRQMISDNVFQYNNKRYSIEGGYIKHHETIYLDTNKMQVIYQNQKYNIKVVKTLKSKTGLSKYS